MSKAYVIEKLTDAVECLATYPHDVRKRLYEAYLDCHTLRAVDFPEELRGDWNWIVAQLTKFGPIRGYDGAVWRGSVRNTTNRIRNATGTRIAKRLFDLYWAVSTNSKYD